MRSEETINRVAGEICAILELDMGLGVDCHYLFASVEDAVRSVTGDSPHVELHAVSPEAGQAAIIRNAVVAVLHGQRMDGRWIDKMAPDIEHAALQALRGEPSERAAAGLTR